MFFNTASYTALLIVSSYLINSLQKQSELTWSSQSISRIPLSTKFCSRTSVLFKPDPSTDEFKLELILGLTSDTTTLFLNGSALFLARLGLSIIKTPDRFNCQRPCLISTGLETDCISSSIWSVEANSFLPRLFGRFVYFIYLPIVEATFLYQRDRPDRCNHCSISEIIKISCTKICLDSIFICMREPCSPNR